MYTNDKNTLEHWNKRFAGDWQENKGCEQTEFWANLIFQNIPAVIIKDINDNKLEINDIGCGIGELCKVASEVFPNSKIKGFDFSDVAITKAKEKNSRENIEFINDSLKNKSNIIILSNILEHTYNPMDVLNEFSELATDYIIVLVPYKENPDKLVPEHCVSIPEGFFPQKLGYFNKIIDKTFDVTESKFWSGEMELCVYQKVAMKRKKEKIIKK